MKKTIVNISAYFVGSLILASGLSTQARPTSDKIKPNIIFFLVDDMGWMDCTVNGSKYYETPNIERLAERGIVFSSSYTVNPLCSPTRASIMTGKYPERFHLTTPSGHLPPNPDTPLMKESAAAWNKVVCPDSRHFMPLEEYTIAEALKTAGYATAHMGKWHCGQEAYWPENQGFDINVGGGSYPGPPSYFSPYHNVKLTDGPDKEYITDRLTDEAMKYLDLAGLKPQKNQIIDGGSLYSLLLNGKPLKKRELYCHFPHYTPATDNYPSTSVHLGDWKLIRVYGEGPNRTPAYELYNLREDIGESNNLAASNPKMVAKLDKLIEKHVNDTQGIFPVLNPKFVAGTESPMGIKPVFPIDKYPSY